MNALHFKNRPRGFTLVQCLVVFAVITILLSIIVQLHRFALYHAEVTSLSSRAGHFATALQLYYQNNRKYPGAYPAQLQKDLAPYIDNPEFFVSPAHPDAGPDPLNRSYVTPVRQDGNTYVLSFETKHDDRAVVLFADTSVEVVDTLPIVHNQQEVRPGASVTGGTLTFDGGSTIDLAGNTTATVVASFQTNDGTTFDIVKVNQGESGSLTAVAVDTDIVEIAADSGVTFLRGGVADIELGPDDQVKVAAHSGEVVVNGGQVFERGQLVADVVEQNPDNGELFTIDENHNLVAQEDCIAYIRVLGKAITYGAGGPDCAVRAGAKFGDEEWAWLFDNQPVYGGEEYSRFITAGTTIAVQGRASYGSWSRSYKSTVHHQQVLVCRNGDMPPKFEPFDGQPEITEFCSSIIDPSTGRITIENHQALFLFELGTTNMHSRAADFQDLVLLVDFARVGSSSSGSSSGGSTSPPPPPIENYRITIDENNKITVLEDVSVGVRVIGTSLRNAGGGDVPIALKLKVNKHWKRIRNGRAVSEGYLYRRKVRAGSTLCLKAISYNGSDSASYYSADGTGHVLVAVKDDVPAPFASNPPAREAFLDRVLDPSTHKVTLAPNQVLMMFELKEEDATSPNARFQDIVCVLTFTPHTLHRANRTNGFDGYSAANPDMGTPAAAFAQEHDISWIAVRESDIPQEGDGSDGGSSSTGIGGLININPGNCTQFEFILEKPDGSQITRDDLHASNGDLEYTGPATRIRLKPKGNGNQNSLTLNGEPYRLYNCRVYTIVGNMVVHLYNDCPGNGHGMGRWWISINASDGNIMDNGPDASMNNDDTPGVDSASPGSGRSARMPTGGSKVKKGWWAKIRKFQ